LKSQSRTIEDENNLEFGPVGAFNNSDLYNAMLHPFTRMVIKGAIWYQGNLELKN
jgi:hypothetical protein